MYINRILNWYKAHRMISIKINEEFYRESAKGTSLKSPYKIIFIDAVVQFKTIRLYDNEDNEDYQRQKRSDERTSHHDVRKCMRTERVVGTAHRRF